MWRKAKVTAGSETADDAMVDFADRTSANPQVLEWPVDLDPDTEIKIGDETRYAGQCSACARQIHVALLRDPSQPKEAEPAPMPKPKSKISQRLPAVTVPAELPSALEPAKPKGKKP